MMRSIRRLLAALRLRLRRLPPCCPRCDMPMEAYVLRSLFGDFDTWRCTDCFPELAEADYGA